MKNNSKGFSIVEIMIVLIVVGLVTTGVLLAAQTLQRNARNDARDRDVQLIGTALSDYAAANSGHLTAGNSAVASATSFLDDLNLTHYDSNNTNTDTSSIATAANTSSSKSYFIIRDTAAANSISSVDHLPDTDNIHIWVGYKCPGQVNLIGNGAIVDGDTNGDGDNDGTETWKYTDNTATMTAKTTMTGDHATPPTDLGSWTTITGDPEDYGSYGSVSKRAFAIVYQHEGGGAPYRCVDFGS